MSISLMIIILIFALRIISHADYVTDYCYNGFISDFKYSKLEASFMLPRSTTVSHERLSLMMKTGRGLRCHHRRHINHFMHQFQMTNTISSRLHHFAVRDASAAVPLGVPL
jgi:hypothetical protein